MTNVRDLLQKHSTYMPPAWQPPNVGSVVAEPDEDEMRAAREGLQKWGLKNRPSKVGGAFGSYLQLTRNVGVKVIRGHEFNSPEEVFKKGLQPWEDACCEALNLSRGRKLLGEMVPKLLSLEVVSWNNKYYIALLVQHINGKMLADLANDPRNEANKLLDQTLQELGDAGIVHRDCHMGNVMLIREKRKDHIYVVDWGTCGVDLYSGKK